MPNCPLQNLDEVVLDEVVNVSPNLSARWIWVQFGEIYALPDCILETVVFQQEAEFSHVLLFQQI